MTARTHDAFAFASLITVATYMQPQQISILTLFVAIVANIVGSLVPDMDQAGNRLWDLLPAGDTIGKVFRRIFYKHRTISHSLLGAFIIYKFCQFLFPYIFNPLHIDTNLILYSLMIGYASHLLADSMTKEGIPILFPFKLDLGIPPIRVLRITTGEWVENYIVLPLVGIYVMAFIYYHQSQLVELLMRVTN